MGNITLTQIIQKLEYIQNDVEILDSLTSVTFTAAACNISSIEDFTGTLELLSIKTQELYNAIAAMRKKLQQEVSNEKNA